MFNMFKILLLISYHLFRYSILVCSKNYLLGRKPVQNQYYFRGDRFQCCYFPFIRLKVLFFSCGCLLNSPQKNTDSHFASSASAIELCDFFHGSYYSIDRYWFPSAEAASLILAEVSSSSLLLVLSSSSPVLTVRNYAFDFVGKTCCLETQLTQALLSKINCSCDVGITLEPFNNNSAS